VLDPRSTRGNRRNEGAAAVEFTLVALILFALLFGIIAFGIALFNQQGAVQAAREAARKAAIGISSANDCQDALTAGRSATGAATGSFTGMSMSIPNNAYRQPVTVKVDYTLDLSMIAWLPGIPQQIQAAQTAKAALEIGHSGITGDPVCTWSAGP
jgi:Flp pilus assembly protein TadG